MYLVAQAVGIACALAIEHVANPDLDLDQWTAGAETNGLVLALATISGALLGIPATLLATARVEPRPWRFFGFTPVPLKTCLFYCAVLLAFIAASDALTVTLGRPIVPQFMISAYSSAGSLATLLLALVVAAPLFEEVAFRGFLLSAMRARGVSVAWCAVLTSLFWSVIHLQYDYYDVGTIFFLGLLLAWTRLRSGSIIPALSMHALANAIAFAETAVVVERAAA